MAAPPALPDELVEEILLRLPPDDPGCLLRASLVCKTWGLAISHRGFRRLLHELHGTPPVLGFLHNWHYKNIPRFIPTTASSFSLAAPDYRFLRALDCRHGRALFLSEGQGTRELLLWQPITGAQQPVPVPAAFKSDFPTAAVFCAADGCDHVDCLGGPFSVVFVFAADVELDTYAAEKYVTSACVYSSETGTWGELISLNDVFGNFEDNSSVLVGRSLLYFMSNVAMILEYDLVRHRLTVVDPPNCRHDERYNLILSEGGGLGVSEVMNPHLKLWSWEAYDGTDGRWVLSRVINLENLLPNGALVDERFVHVLGFAEGANVIFLLTLVGIFTIELQSDRVRKVCDNHGFCNLIPVVGFYTPHSRLKAPGGEHHCRPPRRNPTKEEILKFAHVLFDKGCMYMQERNFGSASDCFSRVLKIRVLHYGKLAPQCASTFYRYGRALLCKALAGINPSGSVSKSVPDEELVKITSTTSKEDAGSSSASGSNVELVPPSERGDYPWDQFFLRESWNEDVSDLHLAWKMLDIARAIVVKSPEKTKEKFDIFCALAEVSVKRGDGDSAIGYYLEALAILEHFGYYHIGVSMIARNFRICLVFELASKVDDAIPYCAKAISACKSGIQYMKDAKKSLLADKDVTASAAGQHSGKFTLEDHISSLTRILPRLQKKLEELEKSISNPSSFIDKITKRVVSQTNPEQNVSNTAARATSSTSQMAGSDNNFYFQTMSTTATTGSTGSSVNGSGIVSRGIKRANDKLISAEPSPKRLAADDSPSVKCDSS
ncbi:hypothetical protein ACQ4PT_002317 [Festuca glaucescens]